jgi:hypothetical protein
MIEAVYHLRHILYNRIEIFAITVIATNAAGLKDISYSDPILVDLTPPIINFVYDGRGRQLFVLLL